MSSYPAPSVSILNLHPPTTHHQIKRLNQHVESRGEALKEARSQLRIKEQELLDMRKNAKAAASASAAYYHHHHHHQQQQQQQQQPLPPLSMPMPDSGAVEYLAAYRPRVVQQQQQHARKAGAGAGAGVGGAPSADIAKAKEKGVARAPAAVEGARASSKVAGPHQEGSVAKAGAGRQHQHR